MKNRFLSCDNWILGQILRLDSNESHHLLKVFRTEIGESLELVDGRGSVASATLISCIKGIAEVRIDSITKSGHRPQVQVAFGVPKGQSLDFIFHRCTEIGVASFQPLETQHSVSVDRWNSDRWERVIIEVAKQCQETFFPRVLEPKKLSEWLENREPSPLLVCLEGERETPRPNFSGPVTILVGPEGGWSINEEKIFRSYQYFQSLGLGPNRLRAETAAVTALILAKLGIGEW